VTRQTASSNFRTTGRLSLWLAVAVACSLLGACAANGDFGRIQPTQVRDETHNWLGPAATGDGSSPTWTYQLTDEERRLRDLAYPLIEPPYDRHQWNSILGEYGISGSPRPYPDRAEYTTRLFQMPYRSQTARYNKLIEDIRNDVTRLDTFFSVASYVSDMDRKREKSLAYVSHLTAEERDRTMRRVRENAAVTEWVQGSLRERVESYRIALERLVIAAPSPNAVEAERSLSLLRQRLSSYGV
jgi:hypothetical protein